MSARRLIGSGVFAGFGMGQLAAWLMVRSQCPHAPALVALSTFGIGMAAYGLMTIVYFYRKAPRSG